MTQTNRSSRYSVYSRISLFTSHSLGSGWSTSTLSAPWSLRTLCSRRYTLMWATRIFTSTITLPKIIAKLPSSPGFNAVCECIHMPRSQTTPRFHLSGLGTRLLKIRKGRTFDFYLGLWKSLVFFHPRIAKQVGMSRGDVAKVKWVAMATDSRKSQVWVRNWNPNAVLL